MRGLYLLVVFLIFWNMGGQSQNVEDSVPAIVEDALLECGLLSFPSVSHEIYLTADVIYSPECGYVFSAVVEVLRNGSTTFYKEWLWDVPSIQSKI